MLEKDGETHTHMEEDMQESAFALLDAAKDYTASLQSVWVWEIQQMLTRAIWLLPPSKRRRRVSTWRSAN